MFNGDLLLWDILVINKGRSSHNDLWTLLRTLRACDSGSTLNFPDHTSYYIFWNRPEGQGPERRAFESSPVSQFASQMPQLAPSFPPVFYQWDGAGGTVHVLRTFGQCLAWNLCVSV